MARIIDLNDFFQNHYRTLQELSKTDSPLQSDVQQLISDFESEYQNPAQLLTTLHATQRIEKIYAAQAEQNSGLLKALEACEDPLWDKGEGLPVDPKLEEGLAEQFLIAPLPKETPKYLIYTSLLPRHTTEALIEQYVADGESFDVQFQDSAWDYIFVKEGGLDDEALTAAGEIDCVKARDTDKAIALRDTRDAAPNRLARKSYTDSYNKSIKIYLEKATGIDNYFTLTIIPSQMDAELDELDYADYLDLFFQSCDQPWQQIETAQQSIVERLNKGKELHITNSDGTDITFDIEEFTFANSMIEANIPGSEVFSAPARTGVNGKIVAKGKFIYKGEVMEDITLVFDDGYATEETHARVNDDAFQDILNTDEGSCYLGEVALGTHPWLKRHNVNGLLVEKIGGSFHVALGQAYNMSTFKCYNGNDSEIHWDITTMLYGKDGKILIDGELIQSDGIFLDPKLAVLNESWGALPDSEIPDRWKELLEDQEARKIAGHSN